MDLNIDEQIKEVSLDIDIKEEKQEDKNIVFSIEDTQFDLPLRISDFESENDLKKFIKNVEKTVRFSIEYKYWVSYITEALGHNSCSLTYENMSECRIDIHHHPITLYDICNAVINKQISLDKKFCTFDIATQVIELHFKNYVGYIPLLSSLHEKYHNGFLQIPIEFVYGNYKYLLNTLLFDEKVLDKITKLTNITKKDCQDYWNIEKGYPSLREESA